MTYSTCVFICERKNIFLKIFLFRICIFKIQLRIFVVKTREKYKSTSCRINFSRDKILLNFHCFLKKQKEFKLRSSECCCSCGICRENARDSAADLYSRGRPRGAGLFPLTLAVSIYDVDRGVLPGKPVNNDSIRQHCSFEAFLLSRFAAATINHRCHRRRQSYKRKHKRTLIR